MVDYSGLTYTELIEKPALIAGFLIEYKKHFDTEGCFTCGGGLRRAWNEYQQKMYLSPLIIHPKTKIMGTSKYKIKDGIQTARLHNTAPLSNATLTDAVVERILDTHPNCAKWFEMADGSPLKVTPVNQPKPTAEALKQEAKQIDIEDAIQTANAVVNATPSAVSFALLNGIDLSTVIGSGNGGRVTLKDLK